MLQMNIKDNPTPEKASFQVGEMKTVLIDNFDRSVHVGISSVIGKRREQQDAVKSDDFSAYMENGRAIAVLCDGMGGMSSGGMASELCSSIVFESFHNKIDSLLIPDFYRNVISESDNAVRNMTDENGSPVKGSGTTMVSVVIDGNKLYWASVGDSRIYILRNDELLCITTDHNYLMLLNERVKRGEITKEEAESDTKKELLISYIGIGGVRYVDMNSQGLNLLNGDYVILCSDGLYRSVSEEEIKQIVHSFEGDAQQIAEVLTDIAIGKNYRNQDNTSVVVISFQDSG